VKPPLGGRYHALSLEAPQNCTHGNGCSPKGSHHLFGREVIKPLGLQAPDVLDCRWHGKSPEAEDNASSCLGIVLTWAKKKFLLTKENAMRHIMQVETSLDSVLRNGRQEFPIRTGDSSAPEEEPRPSPSFDRRPNRLYPVL